MKKTLSVLLIIVVLIAGAAWYMLNGANDFIRTQIEIKGSKYLATPVSVSHVDLSLSDKRMAISDIDVENPDGFSDEDAFSLDGVTLKLGQIMGEPYVVDEITIDGPEILYEVNASGQGNLLVLKNNLQKNLPKQDNPTPPPKDSSNPLIKVNSVTVSNVRLLLNFEALETGELNIDKKAYEVTLPTFKAGGIGQPNGMPADQVGAAIVSQMLDNVISQAKSEAKKVLAKKAREKVSEKINEEKDKLMNKANDKLKDMFKSND